MPTRAAAQLRPPAARVVLRRSAPGPTGDPVLRDPSYQLPRTPMTPGFKPAAYSTVSPYLILEGAEGTIRFLTTVFGAEEIRRFSDDAGGIIHAEVRIDDTVLMLADGNERWPPLGAHVHVYVADVDEVYERALATGAESVQVPAKGEDDDKRGGVKDAGGTTWWIATKVT